MSIAYEDHLQNCPTELDQIKVKLNKKYFFFTLKRNSEVRENNIPVSRDPGHTKSARKKLTDRTNLPKARFGCQLCSYSTLYKKCLLNHYTKKH